MNDKHHRIFPLAVISVSLLTGFISGSAIFGPAGQRTYGDSPRVVVVSVFDGDTFTVDIPSWPPIVGEKIGVRLLGVDCPEMKSQAPELKALAVKAKEFTAERLSRAKRIELHGVSRDKYFRIGADVVLFDRKRGGKGERLSGLLIAAGLAKPYDGGAKTPWEPE